MNKVIIHCDMNNYFASVEMLKDATLQKIPFIVAGDPSLRHGIVLSKNELAKKYNIITGESSASARQKCPNIVIVRPNYHDYVKYAKLSRAIYQQYTKEMYPYGLDEAWLDVSSICLTLQEGQIIAQEIKKRIKEELHLQISVGISFNFVFAKLASDLKIKEKIVVFSEANFKKTVWMLPVKTLLFVGSKTEIALKNMGIITIGDLARADIGILANKFGKKGRMLHGFANGDDSKFNFASIHEEDIKSLGNTITPPKDIYQRKDALDFIAILSCILTKRLKKHHFKARCLMLTLKQNNFEIITKQKTLDHYSDHSQDFYNLASVLLKKNYDFSIPLRNISLRVSKFIVSEEEQLSFFEQENSMEMESIVNRLRKIYGTFDLEESATKKDWEVKID